MDPQLIFAPEPKRSVGLGEKISSSEESPCLISQRSEKMSQGREKRSQNFSGCERIVSDKIKEEKTSDDTTNNKTEVTRPGILHETNIASLQDKK